MTSIAQAATQAAAPAAVPVSTEKRDTAAFFAIVAALLGVFVAAGVLFGLSGIGMVAIAGAGAMLVICLLLTAG